MKLEAERISFSYGERKVLDDVSITLPEGSMTALLGRNGSGKTTLLRLLLGFLKPKNGTIRIDGKDTGDMTDRERAMAIAYIPQSTSIIYSYTVLDTVIMGRAPALSLFQRPSEADKSKAEETLKSLGLWELRNRSVNALSGGERQLVLIARALTQEAGILLLDEPTSSLDYSNQLLVMATAEKLRKAGYTILFSTHNPEQALMNATDVVVLSSHKLAFSGKPEELLDGKVLENLYSTQLHIEKIDTGLNHRIVCVPR